MFEDFFGSENIDIGKGLGIAMDLENRSRTYYLGKASYTGTTEGRRLFEFLAREELRHLKALEGLKEQLAGSALKWGEAGTKVKPDIFRPFDAKKIEEIPIPESILDAAINVERESIEFYTKFSAKIGTDDGRKFFAKLADFEKSHFDLLNQLLELSGVKVEGAGAPGEV